MAVFYSAENDYQFLCIPKIWPSYFVKALHIIDFLKKNSSIRMSSL
jgi:hypothetical protein